MSLEKNAEEIECLPLVPVCGIPDIDNVEVKYDAEKGCGPKFIVKF